MTVRAAGSAEPHTLPPVQLDEREPRQDPEAGLGALATERGNLPLESIDAAVRITGLVGRIELTQGFHNPHDVALEATYIFPLPDRAAVTAMRLTAADHTVSAELKERERARRDYDEAIAAGQRAAIAEQERPDVFTMRVGNILPGERVSVTLSLVGPLSYEDGEATFRLPLVVAPRYIPGAPTGSAVGEGWAPDTDAVPDASRITPPVLLPGFPNPVRLSIGVDVDPTGLPLQAVRSSLHTVRTEGNHLSIEPGERADRDFILRLSYGEPDTSAQALTLTPDGEGDEGTFRLTVLPPTTAAPPRPRDVVLVLDRSGSMSGWKMVAARRAASRIVDTLSTADRFAVIAFDDQIEEPVRPGPGLHPATDRNRYAAVEFLSRMDSRGGTELLAPLRRALGLLTDGTRDRVVVLVTDGQVGNEDQVLAGAGDSLRDVRVHTVGIDRAVNAGFLGRLAAVGGGRCELVESEDRLDEAMGHIHRRIGAPVVTGLSLSAEGFDLLPETVTPRPGRGDGAAAVVLPDLFPGAPLVATGRYRGASGGAVATRVAGRTRDGGPWSARVAASTVREDGPAGTRSLTAVWARAHLRDLEDRYVSQGYGADLEALEQRIVTASLRFGVLCRFTAWVAVDERVVTEGGAPHRVVQPVELPSGWEQPFAAPAMLRGMTLTGGVAPMAAGSMPAAMRVTFGDAASPHPPRRAPGRFAGRPRRRDTAAPEPLYSEPAPEELAGEPDGGAAVPPRVASAAQREAQRLRAAAEAPEYERRELLADLGTRLGAIALDLAGPAAQAVRELAAELAEEHLAGLAGDALAGVWDRVLALLDGLAAGAGDPGGTGTGRARPGAPRTPFWKRG